MNEYLEKKTEFLTYLNNLKGLAFKELTLPLKALKDIQPSQIGTIVGTLMDAMIPYLDELGRVGLKKHPGMLRDREGYPDYIHEATGFRAELKLLYIDNDKLPMKRPKTAREPSARVTQKVTYKNVDEEIDFLLVIACQLDTHLDNKDLVSPIIVDLDIFPMSGIIRARNKRLDDSGGFWTGDYETPYIISKAGAKKKINGHNLDKESRGKKAAEKKDYNEDTNFGKLNRIPYPELIGFLGKYGYKFDASLGGNSDQTQNLFDDTD